MAGCFPYKDPDCCDCGYNNKLYEISREFNKCPYNASDIYYCLKDAVVRIRTVTGILIEDAQVNQINQGDGFLVKYGKGKHSCLYIVTASQLLLFQLGFGTRIPPPVNLPGAEFFARVDDIYVEVSNVNGKGTGYIYKAVLVGLDGANDVGVLRIDSQEEYNRNNPILNPRKHPSLEWGNSRRTPIGSPLFFLSGEGDPLIQESIVTNNRYFQPQGQPQFEAILGLDLTIQDSGGPFLDGHGRVIGIGVNIPTYNFQGAVAEHVASRIVDAIVGGLNGCYGAQLEVFQDPLGPFLRYRKGFFGFLWEAFNAFATLNASAPPPPPPGPLPNLSWQKLQGLIINDILQGEFGIVSPFLEAFASVPINTLILITNINGCPAGIRAPQIPFNPVSVHSLPGELAVLSYRLSSDGYSAKYRAQAALIDWPLRYDNVFNISVSLRSSPDRLTATPKKSSISTRPEVVAASIPERIPVKQEIVPESIPEKSELTSWDEAESSEPDILGEIQKAE